MEYLEELKEGKHILSGLRADIDLSLYYDNNTDGAVILLDGERYVMYEDPEDGYRSDGKFLKVTSENLNQLLEPESIKLVQTIDLYHIPNEEVNVQFIDNDDKKSNNHTIKYVFTNVTSGEVILEIGTDNCDDYYPYCIFKWYPEKLSCNNTGNTVINDYDKYKPKHEIEKTIITPLTNIKETRHDNNSVKIDKSNAISDITAVLTNKKKDVVKEEKPVTNTSSVDKKMSNDEILNVVMAENNGEEIYQRKLSSDKWEKKTGEWQFDKYCYKVKLAPEILPYTSVDEFCLAAKEHGMFIMVEKDVACMPINAYMYNNDLCVEFMNDNCPEISGKELTTVKWADNTPCGKIIEN